MVNVTDFTPPWSTAETIRHPDCSRPGWKTKPIPGGAVIEVNEATPGSETELTNTKTWKDIRLKTGNSYRKKYCLVNVFSSLISSFRL